MNPDYLNIPFRDDIDFKPQKRKKSAKSLLKQHDVAGADLETVGGYIWIWTSTHWNGDEWIDSIVEFEPKSATLQDFMMYHYVKQGRTWDKGGRKGITVPMQFYFNLQYDSGSIVKMLNDEAIEILWTQGKVVVDAITGEYNPHIEQVKFRWREIIRDEEGDVISNRRVSQTNKYVMVRLLPKKWLSLEPIYWFANGSAWGKKGRHSLGSIEAWDIKQFYGRGSLDSIGQKILGEGKKSGIDVALSGKDSAEAEAYRQAELDNIKQYAIQDSNLTARLTWHKVQQFEAAGVRMNRPYSLASVAERCAYDICDIPTTNDLWKKHGWTVKAAWTAYQGGWFESVGHGLRKNVVDYDLKSAYPAAMYWLPNLEKATLITSGKSKAHVFWNWIDRRKPCSIGFCEAQIAFPKGLSIYPAAKTSQQFGCLVNPRVVKGWFSADEIQEFKQWGATINLGRWFYYVPRDEDYPFRPFVEKFFLMKENNDRESADYQVAKVMLNSLYGKTVQAIKSRAADARITGNLWSSLYGATITGFTRSRLAEFIRLNEHKGVVGVATDGIIMDARKDIIIPETPFKIVIDGIESNLGDWELAMDDCDCIMLMSGVYSLRKRTPKANGKHKVKSTFRGNYALFLGKDWPDNWFTFCEEYADVSEVVRDENWRPHWRPFSIGESRVRGSFDKINQFRIVRASVKALGDSNKRLWPRRKPHTFSDIGTGWYISKPHPNML